MKIVNKNQINSNENINRTLNKNKRLFHTAVFKRRISRNDKLSDTLDRGPN